jgi:hypothetical protein
MVKTKHLKVPETVERLIIVSDLHGQTFSPLACHLDLN